MKDFKKLVKEALTPHYLRENKKFEVGDKVTYLGHPGVITATEKDPIGRDFVSISYDKGTGKRKVRMILAKSDVVKAVNETKYRVEYTTQDGEKAKSRVYNSEKEADKKEKQLVDSGIKKAKVVKVEESINENEAPVKVGDKLKMAYQGSTVRGKTGVVTSVSDDMAQVDFGGGDSYGILFNRIRGNEIINEESVKMPSQKDVNDFFSDTFDEIHYLNSKPVEDWDEYDLSNWTAKVRKSKERGKASYDGVAMREYGVPYDELSEEEKEWVRNKIDMDRGVMEEESKGDEEIKALEKEAEKYPKTDSRYKVIQKKIGDLKSDKDYALPGSKADKKFSNMEEELFTPNEMGAEAVEKEMSESLRKSLKEALNKRLSK